MGVSRGVFAQGLHRWLLRGLRPERLPHLRRPDDVGVPAWAVSEPTLQAADGAPLFAWFIRPDAAPPEGAPALVVMHGWGSTASELLPGAEALRQAGFALLLLDARCHGRSGDAEFTSMPRFAEDIESALAWLRQQAAVDASRLILLGHSVGAAAALLVASRQEDICAVVSLSAFAHPGDVMRRWLRAHHIPMWPLGQWILTHVQQVIGANFDDLAPERTVRGVRAPVLLVHGERDDVVPIDDMRRIRQAASRPVQALGIPLVGHDLSVALDDAIVPRVLRFLAEATKPVAPSRPRP